MMLVTQIIANPRFWLFSIPNVDLTERDLPMHFKTRSSRDDEALQEAATRLVDALGVEDAIFICRSNYWHGVLRLIVNRPDSDLDRARKVRDERPHAPVPGYDMAA